MTRYNRRGYAKKHTLLEDEEFFKEHLENLNMKKGMLDFSSKIIITLFFNES